MLDTWLSYEHKSPCPFKFTLINVSEITEPNCSLKSFISTSLIESYRSFDYLKFVYQDKSEKDLKDYLQNNVFTSNANQISKNVRQGDFGEVLASLIVSHFGKLLVPISKLKWKFNKEKSVFCTDMIAHNNGGAITDIYYFEIKTRLLIRKEPLKDKSNYVTVNAHDSLIKDMSIPNEGIADYLSRLYYEKGEYQKAIQYADIVLNSSKYNKKFELFFIIDKPAYIEDILDDLENLPPALSPLNVTVVLIENLEKIIRESQERAIDEAIKIVFHSDGKS